jgi:hypothetical protein
VTHTYYASEPVVDNFYFVNIPKCASQTVRAWAAQMATKDAVIEEPFRFCILREPWGRLKSTFAYGCGARYSYNFTIDMIGEWYLGNPPKNPNFQQADLLVHFGTQRSFVDGAPCAIDHWYHTGMMRELRKDLCAISGCTVGWQEENRSNYTQDFTVAYNAWFSANETKLDKLLEADLELYSSHGFS